MKIKGSAWKVRRKKRLVDDEGTECLGLCDYDTKTIFIQSGQTKEQEIDTLIHEFFHAALHELHLDIGPIADEMIVAGITECLLGNFKVRPKRGVK